jgi:integrase
VKATLSERPPATQPSTWSRGLAARQRRTARRVFPHRMRQLEERIARAGLWQDHGLIFPSNVGTPLSHRNVVRSFKAVLKRAGLPAGTRLYDLRHTCASLLLNSNVHPKYVQELLGHASIALTLDTYSHVLPGMGDGIADIMDATLGS